ncbi:MAG TPA: type IV secretion system protein [Croceibacterium sp.]|jgi:type IV secretion system protein VirB6
MSAASCQYALDGVGNGVASSLHGVDCAASQMAESAFARLFGTSGVLLPALTILLTIYVALFAFALITGRSRIGINSMTSRLVTIGLVLTFATSWIAYQSVVWNLATGAPNELAGIVMATQGNATDIFAQKIDVVFQALIQASNGQTADSAFSPPGLLWVGGTLLLLGTVGILATSRIALAVLLALGPVFVVLALFKGTRGLFTGWLKGVVLLALAPLFAVLGGSLMLELAVPVLSSLLATPGKIDPQAAMAFFMVAAVHCALMLLVLRVAGTMVAGWSVFGLASKAPAERAEPALAPRAPVIAAPIAGIAVDQARGATSSRSIRLAPTAPIAANDPGVTVAARRETRVVTARAARVAPMEASSPARGIGSRFRIVPNRRWETPK